MAVNYYTDTSQDHLSTVELELYHLIMEYRAEQGLEAIPLSKALTTTAGRHALDTYENIWVPDLQLPEGANLHSWSDAPYYSDHSEPEVMWYAPDRLGTGYTSSGYEISAAGYATVEAALDGWKGSPGHNSVILNLSGWGNLEWTSIGIGVEQNFSYETPYGGRIYHVWFGSDADQTGVPDIAGDTGDNTMEGTAFNDRIYGLEGADLLIGGKGADTLFGGSQDDEIFGGDANDHLFGGSGADRMDGEDNSDTYFIDAFDTLIDTGSSGYDKAQVSDANGVAVDLGGWSGIERVNGFSGDDTLDASAQSENLVLSGGGGHDSILGGSGDDVLLGGAGDDTLSGGNGHDTILGGTDNDRIEGGDGNDVIFIGQPGDIITDGGAGFDKAVINNAVGLEVQIGDWLNVERINGFTGDDTIDATGLQSRITIAASAGDDVITGGSADDTVYAGSGADDLRGGAGRDALIGGADNDRLQGDQGNDFLLGGTGADSFAFASGFGRDVIQDFTDGTDRLDFSDHAGVSGMGDLVVAQNGANTEISLATGGTDLITLVGVQSSTITSADFDFF